MINFDTTLKKVNFWNYSTDSYNIVKVNIKKVKLIIKKKIYIYINILSLNVVFVVFLQFPQKQFKTVLNKLHVPFPVPSFVLWANSPVSRVSATLTQAANDKAMVCGPWSA